MIYLVESYNNVFIVMTDTQLKDEERIGNCPKIIGEIIDGTDMGATDCSRHFYEGTPVMLTLRQAYGDKDSGHYGFFEWLKFIKKVEINHYGKAYKKNVIIWNKKEIKDGQ